MDLAALRSPEGRQVLAAVTRRAGEEPLRTLAALRRDHPADLVAAALTQVRLRIRARAKFGADADRMYFTADGLEQATRPQVAAHRAARYAAAGAGRVIDLGCGIGGDLLALARAGLAAHGVDRDALTAAVAAANADELGVTSVTVSRADATEVDLTGWPAAFVDPARRQDGRRVFDPSRYCPPFGFLPAVAARVPLTGAKVAPGIPHEAVPDGVEAEWVSHGGEVTEAALWWGELATARRRATLLPSGATLTGQGSATAPTGPPGRYLYEPDGAVIRAHLVAEFAAGVGGRLLDPTIAYVTADTLVATPFGRAYEVSDVLAFSLKRLRALLRARDVGTVTVKKRGSAIDPERLRRDLRLSGSGTATVVLTRVAGTPTAVLCHSLGGELRSPPQTPLSGGCAADGGPHPPRPLPGP